MSDQHDDAVLGGHEVESDSGGQSAVVRALVATLAAAITALLAHLCGSFGLFATAPEWVAPIAAGAIVAVASRAGWKWAAAGCAVGLGVGLALARPWFLHPSAGGATFLGWAALYVVLASLTAGAVSWLLGRVADRQRAERIAALLLVAAIIAGMWTTTAMVNSQVFTDSGQSLSQVLSVRPELGNTPTDWDYYLRLFYDVHDGQQYYDSVARVWLSDPIGGNSLPIGVTSYRLPTIFYLWRFLPRNGAALPWAFLVFATVAVGAAFSIGAQLGQRGPAVLGALAVATACLLIATTTWVTFVDGWAMALTLAGIALFVAYVRKGSRGLLWASVAACLAAASMRELLVYPMLLAAASALLAPAGKRWRDVWPWLAALACFVAIYAAHVAAIAGRISPSVGYGYWLNGGPAHLLATTQFFDAYFGAGEWLVPVLVVAGIAGAATVWGSQRRLSAFLVASTALPLAAFLVVGNGGREIATGATSGYWGILVVPTALSLFPVALGAVFGLLDKVGMTRGERAGESALASAPADV